MQAAPVVVAGCDELEQQVRRAERAGRFLRPFEEREPRSGEDVVKSCVIPLLTGREPIQIKVIHRKVRKIIGFEQGECRALDSTLETELAQDGTCQGSLAGAQISAQVHDN